MIESVAASRREPKIAEVLRESVAAREERLATVIRSGQDTGEIAPGVSPEAVSRLCTLLALGAAVTHAIDLPAPPAAAWEAVIGTLVDQMQAGGT